MLCDGQEQATGVALFPGPAQLSVGLYMHGENLFKIDSQDVDHSCSCNYSAYGVILLEKEVSI